MSIKRRRILAVFTAVCWIMWLGCVMGQQHMGADGPGHGMATLVWQMLTCISTVALILAYLVAPILATVRVWHEIGRREREQQCTCFERQEVNGNVTPLRRR